MTTNIALFSPGDRFSHSLQVTGAVMEQFARMSGDWNALHHEASYAARHKFERPIVYGNIMGAMLSRLIGMELPTTEVLILRQSLDFRTPAYVGDSIILEAEVSAVVEAVQAVQLKLSFYSESKEILCTGTCLFKVF